MEKNSLDFKKLHAYVWLVLILPILLNYAFRPASGATYDIMRIESNFTCVSPSVVLQNGTDGISFIYANNTSAKISVNATTVYKTYNYSLNIVNNVSDNYDVKLEVYNSQNTGRISNATIILHNNSTFSEQIIIDGGVITQSNGNFSSLNASSTIHIKVEDLKESQDGDSYLYVYLRIKVPNTSVSTLYIITFELT